MRVERQDWRAVAPDGGGALMSGPGSTMRAVVRAGAACRVYNLTRGLVENAIVVSLQADPNSFFANHDFSSLKELAANLPQLDCLRVPRLRATPKLRKFIS